MQRQQIARRQATLVNLNRAIACLTVGLVATSYWPTAAKAQEPTVRYELSINGENFTVDSDRIAKLRSTTKPGTVYEVGIRLAQSQPWTLNSAQFEYHVGCTVSDDRQSPVRTAIFKHDLGWVMTVTDLGGPMPPENQDKTLQLLVGSVQKSIDPSAARKEVGKPAVRTIGMNMVRGVTILYDDKDGVGHSSLIYLVTGDGFACSCIVQVLDADRENALPLITATLESFRGKKK